MSKKSKQTPGVTKEHTLKVQTPSGPATLVLSQKGRRFDVISFTVAANPDLSLAFKPTGPGIENLDESSDAMQVFNCSSRIRVDGYIVLSSSEMIAPSVEELEAALKKAKISPFLSEEI